jgi:hypothetical protein
MRLVNKGTRYALEMLPVTDLTKMIVATNTEGKGARGVRSKAMEIPFFGDLPSIESLILAPEVDWFTTVYFDGTRNIKNAIQGQNMIAFDIDEGMTLNEAIQLLNPYVYLIYTTRNHQKDKKGRTYDRFRIIMPTKQKFYVDNEQHKKMLENIANIIGMPSYDISTRNQDRLWFPNPEGKVYASKTGELIDVTCCIPSTEKEEYVTQQVGSVDTTEVSDDRRIQGMIRWTISNAVVGGRNNALLRLHRFVKDLTGSKTEADSITYQVNAILNEPLEETELAKTVCK